MNRVWVFSIVFLLISTTSMATPYQIHYFEDFQDDELAYMFTCPFLVDEPPVNPGESYALIVPSSFDGSLGLHLVQGSEGSEPAVFIFSSGCGGGLAETIIFDVDVPLSGTFGILKLVVNLGSDEFETIEYSEPGSYFFEFADDEDMHTIFWIGHDVVIDNLYYSVACGGYTMNEPLTWGGLKAQYR